MPLFIWKPSYELGIPEIDHDHRLLVGMINELYEAIKEGHDHGVVNQSIDRLLAYVKSHFETEESFMRACRFPDIEKHEAEHRRFAGDIRAMDLKRREGHAPMTFELMNYLRDWLRDHVTSSDKEIGAFVKAMRS